MGARQGWRGAGNIAIIAVGDPHDPRLADYRNIPDPALAEPRGIFIAEGRLVVQRLLSGSRFPTRSVMVTDPALASLRSIVDAHPDTPVYVVPSTVMDDVAGFNVHRGCLAIGERPAPRDWLELARAARRLVILERIGDPDNVGSVFRNAAAFGVGAVLLDRASADPLYRKAIRTSMGAALRMPFARVHEWPHALRELDRDGVAVIALTPSSSAPCLRTVARALSDRRIALVLGHEGEGLTRAALDACPLRARIPMAGDTDSVNVATAAAIAMYELASRNGPPDGDD
jgi:tRNA G18 (ribose-2'-O)-methylase SpoU